MNKKIIIIVLGLVLVITSLLFFTKNKKQTINNKIEKENRKDSFYYDELPNEDGYVIYNGDEKVDLIMDEGLIESQMHIYEIDPDYDGGK